MTSVYLDFAITIARQAGKLVQSLQPKEGRCYKIKSTELDIVTKADTASEKLIIDAITKKFPDHLILAEEQFSQMHKHEYHELRDTNNTNKKTQISPNNIRAIRSHSCSSCSQICNPQSAIRNPQSEIVNPFRWLIDPLDGTTNYSHGFPYYCVSIALLQNEKPLIGVVYNPTLEEMFSASLGKGAFLNGKCIKVSQVKTLSKSLLCTGFPYFIRENPGDSFIKFQEFCLTAQAIRRAGAAALDLCYVACGRFDGFWELDLKPWDTAAGSFILTEAGGRATDFRNNKYHPLLHRAIIASNKYIHQQMVGILSR